MIGLKEEDAYLSDEAPDSYRASEDESLSTGSSSINEKVEKGEGCGKMRNLIPFCSMQARAGRANLAESCILGLPGSE